MATHQEDHLGQRTAPKTVNHLKDTHTQTQDLKSAIISSSADVTPAPLQRLTARKPMNPNATQMTASVPRSNHKKDAFCVRWITWALNAKQEMAVARLAHHLHAAVIALFFS